MDERHVTFRVRKVDVKQGACEVLINARDADRLSLETHDRVHLRSNGREVVAIVDITESMIPEGEIGLYVETWERLGAEEGDEVLLTPVPPPSSVEYIRKKIHGEPLTQEEIRAIITDIVKGMLSMREITAYSVAVQIHDMSMEEIMNLTKAMVETGESITFSKHPVVDVHSIGGVPGNKYAAITVPIVAHAGLLIPKTSSRAISSACGTADYMEVITEVVHSGEEIRRIAESVGGTLVWGGGVNLAPADDIIIQAERPLSLDPHAQVLASVMAKKIAAGVEILLIDIPMGAGTKVERIEDARRLARDFIELGRRLDMDVRCAITYGGQPLGRAIGPALEAREALKILEGEKTPKSVREKALELAGVLLEMGGVAVSGKGKEMAEDILRTGKAREKFLEIVNAQGSKGIETSEDIETGRYTAEVVSERDGYVEDLSNRAFVRIARSAGAPADKGAGVVLHKKEGERVEEGERIFTIYAEARWKLTTALQTARSLRPVRIEGMILEEIME